MDIVLVGIGGAFGAVFRFQLGRIITQKQNTAFPLATFIINITGAVLLGIITSVDAGNNTYLLLGDGFLGAYTTFSTFMYEGFNLLRGQEKLNAFIYVLGSLILGITGYVIGFVIGKMIIA